MPSSIIDWREEGARSAQAIAHGTQPQFRSLDSKSAGIEMPAASSENGILSKPFHRPGDSQFLGNGELITWTEGRNGRCYVTNQPAATVRLDEKGIVTVCKHRIEPVRADLVDAMKSSYPAAPDTIMPRR